MKDRIKIDGDGKSELGSRDKLNGRDKVGNNKVGDNQIRIAKKKNHQKTS